MSLAGGTHRFLQLSLQNKVDTAEASALEGALAELGGICISGQVKLQMTSQLLLKGPLGLRVNVPGDMPPSEYAWSAGRENEQIAESLW